MIKVQKEMLNLNTILYLNQYIRLFCEITSREISTNLIRIHTTQAGMYIKPLLLGLSVASKLSPFIVIRNSPEA